MSSFINNMTEEILNESIDFKKIARKFFKKHPDLLRRAKQICKEKDIKPVDIEKKDYKIIRYLYLNNDVEKARDEIERVYNKGDKKYKYWMNLIDNDLNEAMKKGKLFLLSIAVFLAVMSGMLSGCNMPTGPEVYDYDQETTTPEETVEEEIETDSGTFFQQKGWAVFTNNTNTRTIKKIEYITISTWSGYGIYGTGDDRYSKERTVKFFGGLDNTVYDWIEPGDEKRISLSDNERIICAVFSFHGTDKKTITWVDWVVWDKSGDLNSRSELTQNFRTQSEPSEHDFLSNREDLYNNLKNHENIKLSDYERGARVIFYVENQEFGP
ncbi:MAG: hypothetical protein ACOCP4_06145 [Candidatus Woesearchaeota archaeon]